MLNTKVCLEAENIYLHKIYEKFTEIFSIRVNMTNEKKGTKN